jgi:hypothetical protein
VAVLLFILGNLTENGHCLKQKTVHRSFKENLARKIITYFNLNEINIGTSTKQKFSGEETKDSEKCRSLSPKSVRKYFFDVYSNDSSRIIYKSALETMIMRHVSDNPVDKETTLKSKKNICQRRNVNLFSTIRVVKKNWLINKLFFLLKCIQSREMLKLSGFVSINEENFLQVCPIMLYNLELGHCKYDIGLQKLDGGEG